MNSIKISVVITSLILAAGCNSVKKRDSGDFGGGWSRPSEKVAYPAKRPIPTDHIHYAREKTPDVTHISYPGAKPVLTAREKAAPLQQFAAPAAPHEGQVGRIPESGHHTALSAAAEKSKGKRNGNLLLLLSVAGIGASAAGLIYGRRKKNSRFTRFAKYNPGKTQALITVLHVLVNSLGLFGGYNLHKMGYHTDMSYGWAAFLLGLSGFFLIPFFRRNAATVLPRVVNRRRAVMLGIVLSGLTSSAVVGNRLHKMEKLSGLHSMVESADAAMTGAVGRAFYGLDQSPENAMKARMMTGTISTFAAVVLIFLLVIAACAGICLIIAGVGFTIGEGVLFPLFLVPIGAWILYASINGIKAVRKKRRKKTTPQPS